MQTLSGYIGHIIFRNDENGYTVFEFEESARGSSSDAKIKNLSFEDMYEENLVCVGFVRDINEGESVVLTGDYSEHRIYGRQFSFNTIETRLPEDEEAIIRYLGSGSIKGIGTALATRIVKKFGTDTFRIMEEEPERLYEIKGISENKALSISEQVLARQEQRRAMLFLQKYGISNNLSLKIYKKYGEELYTVLSENPYKLAEDIEGVGFRTADEIAVSSGIKVDSVYRIRSGVLYVLKESFSEGHCYLPKDQIIKRAAELLFGEGADPDLFEDIWVQVKNLAMDKKLVIKTYPDTISVYDSSLYYLELSSAKKLLDLRLVLNEEDERTQDKLKRIEMAQSIDLDETQRLAVMKAVKNGVTVITGGPGTGKTTIINMILKYFEEEKAEVILCAPTGRAAKRMTETTGYEAATIQRTLHLTPYDTLSKGGYYYGKNEEEPLEADVIIVDEMSMVDLPLFSSLLKAILPGTRLILVGDIDQLPSVGPGAVLKDIIASGCFEDSTVRLTKIFRQAEESDIIVNAHKINRGEHISLNNKSRDFFFLERDDVNKILNNLVILIRDKLPSYVNSSPFDIQVLTPMKKGTLGVENLNPILQKYLNPPSDNKKEREIGGVIFREGDKVMQTKNNYQLTWEIKSRYGIVVDSGDGIFNGDMGIIKSIDSFSDTVTVMYDSSRLVEYPAGNLDELSLAYAVTIHKSQGSEYPAVIIPVLSGPKQLFYRNLLYTGVTRAVSCVVLIGKKEKIEYMIDNEDEHRRFTGLSLRLIELSALPL